MPESSPPTDKLFLQINDERRRFARRRAKNVTVAGPVTGELVDMSEAGFGVETRYRPTIQRKGVFRLEIGENRPDFFGQVRWCRLTGTDSLPNGESAPIYRAGVALVDRSTDQD